MAYYRFLPLLVNGYHAVTAPGQVEVVRNTFYLHMRPTNVSLAVRGIVPGDDVFPIHYVIPVDVAP